LYLSNIIKEEYYQRIYQGLETLSEIEVEIISRRFGLLNKPIETQREIAKSMNISRSYVSRIEKRALTKLYLYLKDD
jgi:RNA polymerase sporulation-specific sigma factor